MRAVVVLVCLATSAVAADLRGAEFQRVHLNSDAQWSSGSQRDTASKGLVLSKLLPRDGVFAMLWLRQEPTQQPKLKKEAALPLCLFLACFGVPFGLVGIGTLLGVRKGRAASQLMLSDGARRTNAKITGARHYTETDVDHDTHHYYVAEYTFEAVRSDGMRCRVVVPERSQRYEFWKTLVVNSDEPVLYLVENPGHCRLQKAAEIDNEPGIFAYIIPVFGCAFGLAGFFVGVVVSSICGFNSVGIIGGLLCACTWFSCVGCCFSCIKPMIESAAIGVQGEVEELGFVKRAEHLEDIAGTWQLESDHGIYEYEFTSLSPSEVTVKGRQKGSDAWDPAFQAHFAGAEGTELVWDDADQSHFRLFFDGPEKFTGSVQTDAGQMLEFRGSRQNK